MREFTAIYHGVSRSILASDHVAARKFAYRWFCLQSDQRIDADLLPENIAIIDDKEAARCEGCTPMRWCEPCGSYHHPNAPGCFAKNPAGWQEIDGVPLPSVSPWADLSQSDLDKVHVAWCRRAGDKA